MAVAPEGTPALVAIDWGTTSARAYCVDGAGRILASRSRPLGVQQLAGGDFAAALAALLGDWPIAGVPRIAAGMIGSRQGWVEAPYVECPAAVDALAAQLVFTPARELAVVPGLVYRDAHGAPDVMRGEETQLAGTLGDGEDTVLAVLPGTHSKWVHAARGSILAFRTCMTGELFAVLLGNTILGRLAQPPSSDAPVGTAFARGVDRGLAGDVLSHAIFGARTLALMGELAPQEIADWLSGVLIGQEIADARQWARERGVDPAHVRVVGADALVARYVSALAQAGSVAAPGPADAAVRGLVRIAARAGLRAQ